MRFTTTSTDLLDALKTVNRVIPGKSTLSITEQAYATRDEGHLVLRGTDLEQHLITRLPVQWDAMGGGPEEATLPVRQIKSTLQTMSEMPVEVVITEDYLVRLETDQGRYEMAGCDGTDFPDLPETESLHAVPISAETLSEAIERTGFAVSDDALRPAMMGMYLELNGEVRATATDGHRLSTARLGDADKEDQEYIIPDQALSLMEQVLDEEGTFSAGDGHAVLKAGETTVVTRLIDETFPNYGAVIPDDNDSRLLVDRGDMLSAVQRAEIYSSSLNNKIRLDITEDRLTICAEDHEYSAEAEETIHCDFDGEEMSIGFNAEYLKEVLEHAGGDQVEFELGSPQSAVLVSATDEEDHTLLLMPLMINQSV